MQHPAMAGPIDYYKLHGITRADRLCKKCEKPYSEHPKGYDQNGWVQVGSHTVPLPADWPSYRASDYSD